MTLLPEDDSSHSAKLNLFCKFDSMSSPRWHCYYPYHGILNCSAMANKKCSVSFRCTRVQWKVNIVLFVSRIYEMKTMFMIEYRSDKYRKNVKFEERWSDKQWKLFQGLAIIQDQLSGLWLVTFAKLHDVVTNIGGLLQQIDISKIPRVMELLQWWE